MSEVTATPEAAVEAPAKRSRPVARLLRLLIDLAVIATLFGAVLGFYLRDRVPALAVFTYFPLAPVALGALVWDLLRRGRVLGHARFALSVIALVFVVIGGRWMWATEPLDQHWASHESPFRLVHWNVKWAGSLSEQGVGWDAIADELAAQEPDIIVLSEAPKQIAGDDSDWTFADGWSTVRWYGKNPRNAYYWSVVVSSPKPMRERWRQYIHEGVAICVEIEHADGPLRMLVVDGLSSPLRNRTPFLDAIADLAEQSAADGEPIDIIVGDFNAVSRSIGFDRYEHSPLDLKLAARYGGGWRATGPAILPLIDVDHAWLSPDIRITNVTRFTRSPSDHVGYTLDLRR